jgi:hypothetical protein
MPKVRQALIEFEVRVSLRCLPSFERNAASNWGWEVPRVLRIPSPNVIDCFKHVCFGLTNRAQELSAAQECVASASVKV